MHDCKGRPVAEGDVVKFKDYKSKVRVGIITDTTAQSDTCNLTVSVLTIAGLQSNSAVTAKETELIHKADGSEPEAAPAV